MNSALQLQQQFGIASIATVTERAPGYPVIGISNRYATASIALHGAQVMAFQPSGAEPVLWLSRDTVYAEGKAIRGGIPICWPWFGAHPDGQHMAHGFVRNRFWQLESIEQTPGGSTHVVMSTDDDEVSRSLWNHAFRLRLTVVVGTELSLDLQMENTGRNAYAITAALHSYFHVGDISKAEVAGLEGTQYIDKLESDHSLDAPLVQHGAIRFAGELDRIYYPATADELIHDAELHRTLRLKKSGSRATVVWNPWVEKSASMNDFEQGGYRHMACVETANAAGDVVQLEPGATHVLGVRVCLED